MDKLKTRLVEDAEQVQVQTSPELQARIKASIHAARDQRNVVQPGGPARSLWWISSLTGLTAAAALLLILNWSRPSTTETTPVVADNLPSESLSTDTLPDNWRIEGFSLDVETADLTQSLEVELEHLQLDLERAKKKVEDDVRRSF